MAKLDRRMLQIPQIVRSFYALSPYGTFWIAPAERGCGLYLDSSFLGDYPCPDDAAAAVAAHRTGHSDWDRLVEFPWLASLREWGQLIVIGVSGLENR